MVSYLTPNENKAAYLLFLTIPSMGSRREGSKWKNNLYLVRKSVLYAVAFANLLLIVLMVSTFLPNVYNYLRRGSVEIYDLILIVLFGGLYFTARDTARLFYYLLTGNIKREHKTVTS
jgi:hypothetical protein